MIIKFLLDQDPTSAEYMDHIDMFIEENGCIELMTDISDFLEVKIRGPYKDKSTPTPTGNTIIF